MNKIGFVGQGWIGKNYADDFEARGYEVIRYSLEPEYSNNKKEIANCGIVFIAVPTPTIKGEFDYSAVSEVIKLIGKGSSVVIKSTVLPTTTEKLQTENPDLFIFHAPEFLSVATAREDARQPQFNLIGLLVDNEEYRKRAEEILKVLPKAKYEAILSAKEAELFKYLRNCFFYSKIIYMNLMYDLTEKLDCDWQNLREIIAVDPWIGGMHIDPVHKTGRGAGGGCFIKDFSAFRGFYETIMKNDEKGIDIFKALEEKNLELLRDSNKDLEMIESVYGGE